jgi:hypothetical protein
VPTAYFRFYAELNAFLSPPHRQRLFDVECARDASAKHMIEALGVPHTQVELILANGTPVDFSYRLRSGDWLSVYPYFSSPAIAPVPGSLRSRSDLTDLRFIADSHLGKLARDLRMLGFDVLYRNDFSDAEIAAVAAGEGRVVLTRDRDLLIRKSIARGCYLHATAVEDQLREVIRRYRLNGKGRPLTRCLRCNRLLEEVDKAAVERRLPQRSAASSERFFVCGACDKVYWEGSHTARMRARVLDLLDKAYTSPHHKK